MLILTLSSQSMGIRGSDQLQKYDPFLSCLHKYTKAVPCGKLMLSM